jgi:hypothetical protein
MATLSQAEVEAIVDAIVDAILKRSPLLHPHTPAQTTQTPAQTVFTPELIVDPLAPPDGLPEVL